MASLTELDLSYNRLRELTLDITHLGSLQRLCLGHNHLKTIPADLAALTALTQLDLSNNSLTVLPDSLQGLSCLCTVSLQCNHKLREVPELIFEGIHTLRRVSLPEGVEGSSIVGSLQQRGIKVYTVCTCRR